MSAARTAYVLAAGRGERMRPLTAARAKPTLPVLGRPLLARILEGLAGAGVARVAVNTHHAADSVRELLAIEGPRLGLAIETFHEPVLMGSGGALVAPAAFLGQDELFFLHNGDTLAAAPLAALAEAAADGARRIGALLIRPGRTPGYGGVLVQDGLVLRHFGRHEDLAGAPGTPATFLGVSAVRTAVLPHVPQDRPSDLFPDLVRPLVAAGWSLAAVPYAGPWVEFTSPAQYLANVVRLARAARATGRVALPGGGSVRALPDGVLASGDGAAYPAGVRVEGAAVLERDARVMRGARLRSSLLLEGAEVAWGAALDRVIVDRAVRVPANAAYSGGILTAGGTGAHVFEPFGD